MKTKKNYGIELIEQDFNYDEIIRKVSPLKFYKKNKQVFTTYSGKKISQTTCSEKYGIFNFSEIVQEILPQLSQILNPQSYNLRIVRGVQELKLFTSMFEINHSTFQKMFVIFSSSNGLYPLLIDAGLFRQVCSNGMMASVGENLFAVRTRHYEKALSANLREFRENMNHFQETIDRQIEFVQKMENDFISFKNCISQIILKPDLSHRKTMFQTITRLGKKLLNSQSDSIDCSLTYKQIAALENPTGLLRNDTGYEDIILPKIKVYNCYTELFRNRYHAVNERENRRIEEILLN